MPCYDGITSEVALYSWDRTLQNIIKRDATRRGAGAAEIKRQIYSRDCLIPGVLMRSLLNPHPDTCVLIDEVDKVGQGKYFEALLLEVLGSMQITIIETGEVIRPVSGSAPHIFITSNATDDAPLSSPLLRRGPFIKFQRVTPERMYDIFSECAPQISERLRWSCVLFIHHAQKTEMEKPIALSEAVQWVQCLARQRVTDLTAEVVTITLAYLAKGEKEAQRLSGVVRPILDHISTEGKLRVAA
jgi:MoxR-like ATPase